MFFRRARRSKKTVRAEGVDDENKKVLKQPPWSTYDDPTITIETYEQDVERDVAAIAPPPPIPHGGSEIFVSAKSFFEPAISPFVPDHPSSNSEYLEVLGLARLSDGRAITVAGDEQAEMQTSSNRDPLFHRTDTGDDSVVWGGTLDEAEIKGVYDDDPLQRPSRDRKEMATTVSLLSCGGGEENIHRNSEVETLLSMFGPPHGSLSPETACAVLNVHGGNVTRSIETVLEWIGNSDNNNDTDVLLKKLSEKKKRDPIQDDLDKFKESSKGAVEGVSGNILVEIGGDYSSLDGEYGRILDGIKISEETIAASENEGEFEEGESNKRSSESSSANSEGGSSRESRNRGHK